MAMSPCRYRSRHGTGSTRCTLRGDMCWIGCWSTPLAPPALTSSMAAAVKGLQRSETGRVTGVVLEDESGSVHRVASRVVVGADGMRSTVARLVNAQTYRVGRHASGTMYGHWSGLDVDGYGWYFVPGISAGAIPTNAGQVCVSVSVPGPAFTRLFAHQPDTAFLDLLSKAAPDLARAGRACRPIPSERVRRASPGFFDELTDPAGRWSATPDTSRTRSPRMASRMRCATRNCWPLRSTRVPTAHWLTTRNSAMRPVLTCSRPLMRSRRSTGT